MGTEINFKLQISIRRADDDGPVFKKNDGERFDNSITVKLNAGQKYNLVFTTKPAMEIKKVVLMDEPLALTIQKNGKSDNKTCVYRSEWKAEIEVTKSNERTTIPFAIEMDNGLAISFKFQTKFYPAAEVSHSKWGQEFHLLDLDCTKKEGSTVINVEENYI